ncbi:MAG: acyl-CoA dehydrogenase family protein [Gammaproteobacteria bacterium]|nr:acyl-CoA dehydrogenase family protein [Gammaproteobacteria bacterium]
MNFDPSDDQRLLRDSIDRLIALESDMAHRRRGAALPDGWSRELWEKFAALGFLGLPFAEADGGIGGGPAETMIVMEALGRGLVLEPYFATVVLGGACLRLGAPAALRAELVPRIAAGSLLLAFGWTERQSRYDPVDVTTTARRDGGSWILNGAKSLVMHGDVADKIIVTARVAGGPRERAGLGVFLVDGASAGLRRTAYRSQDGIGAAEITLEDVRVDAQFVLGEPGNDAALIERVLDEAIAARCAEAVGVMAAMQRLTVDHLKTRRQFGRPIGDFQALQHRAVDQLIALELARSMALLAAMMVDAPDAAERRRTIAAAKVQIGRSGRRIGEEAIQLHGGIGMTMEYEVGHYFKRMTLIDRSFGDADWQLAALARAGGLFVDDDGD